MVVGSKKHGRYPLPHAPAAAGASFSVAAAFVLVSSLATYQLAAFCWLLSHLRIDALLCPGRVLNRQQRL